MLDHVVRHRGRRIKADRSGPVYAEVSFLEPLERRLLLSGGVLVTEFMASNGGSWLDGDGNSSDWIELYNPTGSAVSLDGWYLTDKTDLSERAKWPFPDVSIGAGQYMIVVASGQNVDDHVDSRGYMHTNFTLKKEGESVLLIRPDRSTIEHGYANYPDQITDISYGFYIGTTWNTLVTSDAALTYLVPTPGDAGLVPTGGEPGWTGRNFDDAAWSYETIKGGGRIVITEIATGDTDFIEIQNGWGEAIDVTGWTVLVNDGSADINGVGATAWGLSGSISPGQVLYRTDDPGDNYWGSDLPWSVTDPGWAMVIDDAGAIVDFLPWGFSTAEIEALDISYGAIPSITVGYQWFGPAGDLSGFGTPGPVEDAIPFGSTWSYLHPIDGVDPAATDVDFHATWMDPATYNGPDFADSGPGLLGYGRIDLLPIATNIDTPAVGNRHSAYFRREFVLDEEIIEAGIEILSDDGAFVYIDGVEVFRNNILVTQTDTYTTTADGSRYPDGTSVEGRTETYSLANLARGTHTIAVSVHQANSGSSDLGLALRLFGRPVSSGDTLARVGQLDTHRAADFYLSNAPTRGVQNPTLSMPLGIILPNVTGAGFSNDQAAFDDIIGTDVGPPMQGVNASLWTRIAFQAGDVSVFDRLTLKMKYDDGFVAYINGEKVAQRNAPPSVAWNSTATDTHANSQAVVYEEIDISAHLGVIVSGRNVLAIHGLNIVADDGDFLALPDLLATSNLSPDRFFGHPTPGAPNDPELGEPAGDVVFSRPSELFTAATISVELSTASPDAVIRYTTNGTAPTASSPVYSGPLTISATTQVRARTYEPDMAPGEIASETYINTATSLASSTLDIPVFVIETFGGGGVPNNYFQNCFISLFEPGENGWTSFSAGMDIATRGGIKTRGSSTSGQSYAFEVWDETNDDKDIKLLGMPAESDWILYRSSFDRSWMCNSFIYELSNQVGQYAVRTRFVDVYLDTNGGELTSSDRKGVFVLMEKIEQGPDRVDVDDLLPSDTAPPEVTGGYMIKIDRADPGDSGFNAGGQGLKYVYPKESVMESSVYSAQDAWLRNYINEFDRALDSWNFTHPETGKHYSEYFDVAASVDHHILNELTKNPDALRLSTYLYIDRGGKLAYGPVWDFDRALGFEGRSANPAGWYSEMQYGWWRRLFQDPDLCQVWIDRYFELREDEFSVANMQGIVDVQAAQLQQAMSTSGSWPGYRDQLRNWLANRVAWIDSQFRPLAEFSIGSGQVAPGFALRFNALSAPGTIYYTTDGTDPRLPGGGIGGQAYSGTPIVITDYTKVIARVYYPSAYSQNPGFSHVKWGAPTEVVLVVDTPAGSSNLAIAEINYNPYDPTAAELGVDPTFTSEDFEFVELQNTGETLIALGGVKFVDGIAFEFAPAETLTPGARVVVAANQAAFRARYGTGIPLAGQYAFEYGSKFLSNAGEGLELQSIFGQAILDFKFNDSGSWPGRADGKGATLQIVDPVVDHGAASNWNSSVAYGGTPGGAPMDGFGIVVNEVLTHTDLPDKDSIELYNAGTATVDLAGWFLSDSWGWASSTANGNYKKFEVPVLDLGQTGKTLLAPGEYLVFDEDDFNSSGDLLRDFALDGARGDDVWLMQADASGMLTAFGDHVAFGGAVNGESFGRWANGSGELYPMSDVTLGGANSPPRIGPVVITELMYYPGIFHENFADGRAGGFTEIVGDWLVADGRYDSSPATAGGDAIALAGFPEALGDEFVLETSVRIAPAAGGRLANGSLIFDYNGPTDFKYAGAFPREGRWQIGQRTVTGWTITVQRYEPVLADTNYDLMLRIDGSVATLLVDGVVKLSHDFGGVLNDNPVGIGARNSVTSFGTFAVEPRGESDLEFAELHNPTEADVPLAVMLNNPSAPGTQYLADWRLRGAVDMEFDLGVVLPAGGTLVVLSFNPADPANADRVTAFRSYYGIDASVPLVGGYGGNLSNGGEALRLQRSDSPPMEDPAYVPHTLEDEVRYDDLAPWPVGADGNGDSLNRLGVALWGNDPGSWIAAAPTPGTVDIGPPAAPSGVDLQPASDTGADNADNVTKRDNSITALALKFEVAGTIAGATVTVYADGAVIGQTTATGTTTVVTTSGSDDLLDGDRVITARQSMAGGDESLDSAQLIVTIDTVAPTVDTFGVRGAAWALGTVDSAAWFVGRAAQTAPWSAIDQLVVGFSEPVSATVADLMMVGRDTGAINPTAIAGAPGDVVTWTMTLADQYLATDRYTVILPSAMLDAAGNALAGGWTGGLNVVVGDINGDGRVSSRDRRDLRSAYGSVAGGGGYTRFADINGDGRVSSRDRRDLRDYYGTGLPAEAPPIGAPMPAPITHADASPAAPTESDTDAQLTTGPLVIVQVPLIDVSTTAPSARSPAPSASSPSVLEGAHGANVSSEAQLEPDLSSGLIDPLE